MARRKGNEIESVKVMIAGLLEEGLSYRAIKLKLNCSSNTIAEVVKGNDAVDVAEKESFKRNRANLLRNKADYIMDAISPDDIERASLKDKVISIGILNQRASEIEAGTMGATHNHLHLSGLMDRIGDSMSSAKIVDAMKDAPIIEKTK